jgi:hypothetical protein
MASRDVWLLDIGIVALTRPPAPPYVFASLEPPAPPAPETETAIDVVLTGSVMLATWFVQESVVVDANTEAEVAELNWIVIDPLDPEAPSPPDAPPPVVAVMLVALEAT